MLRRRYLLKDSVVVQTIMLEDDAVWQTPTGHILAPIDYTPSLIPIESEIDYKEMWESATTEADKLDILAKHTGLKD